MSDGFFPQVKEFFDFGYMLSVYLADSAQFLKKKKLNIFSCFKQLLANDETVHNEFYCLNLN